MVGRLILVKDFWFSAGDTCSQVLLNSEAYSIFYHEGFLFTNDQSNHFVLNEQENITFEPFFLCCLCLGHPLLPLHLRHLLTSLSLSSLTV